jgi:hypothetical protein
LSICYYIIKFCEQGHEIEIKITKEISIELEKREERPDKISEDNPRAKDNRINKQRKI